MTAIRVESLEKRYGSVTALAGLSLDVAAGELYGLLGPNGAGKTTTMDILTGQTEPDGGHATVLGLNPVEAPVAVRERVGILPEKESPPSLMTPREYFSFVGAVRDLPDTQVERGVDRWADRLGFADALDVRSTDLSRGQQQKVMIAAAFLHDPDVVFIDEPLANLDPIVQERVKRFLLGYQADGNTVLLSTHNVEVAAELCSRVGILDEGTLAGELAPSELEPGRTLLDAFLDRVNQSDDAEAVTRAA